MKKLPLWIRFFLWIAGAKPDELLLGAGDPMVRGEIPRPSVRGHETGSPLPSLPPPPIAELLDKANRLRNEQTRLQLELQLRTAGCALAAAFGTATIDVQTGNFSIPIDARWRQ